MPSRLRFEPQTHRVQAFLGDVAVADSKRAILLFEKNHRPVYYFPTEDVSMDLMSPTAKHTFCPFKGKASYWTITAGGKVVENAAWSYLKPILTAAAIKGYVAFYWNKLDAWYEDDEKLLSRP